MNQLTQVSQRPAQPTKQKKRTARVYPSLAPLAVTITIKIYWNDPEKFDQASFDAMREYLTKRGVTPVLRPASTDEPLNAPPRTIYVKVSPRGWINVRKFASDLHTGMSTTHEMDDPFLRLERLQQQFANTQKGA